MTNPPHEATARLGVATTVSLLVALAALAALAGCVASGAEQRRAATGASRSTTMTAPLTTEAETTAPLTTAPSTTAEATTAAPTTTTRPRSATTTGPVQRYIARPNPALSPGAVFAGVTREQVCTVGYSKSVRNVPQSLKARVYAEYGIASHGPGSYQVDHLISLELGGSNDIKNLWPEPYDGVDGARSKDRVENHLHAEVCAGVITLAAAQLDIVHWDRITVAASSAAAPPPQTTVAAPAGPVGASYANCTAARAAGAAPILRGHPGYRTALDRDGDGVACE